MVKILLGMRAFLLALIMILTTQGSYAQERIQRTTHHYATHDTTELYLDLYQMSGHCGTERRPCVIFMFGGGFVGGTRDNESYAHYFETLARAGITVVSIDYRLGLANIHNSNDMNIREMIGAMNNAVNIAVEDLYAATNYVLEHNDTWGVDREHIIISGSSAGAIATLQAEWMLNNDDDRCSVLPEGFRYGGVIACAGALFSTSGRPKFKGAAAPMLLFHGTSDSNVPYNKASMLGVGFYGSQYIIDELDKQQSPYLFHSVKYADHSLAITPLHDSLHLILHFIDEYVVGGKRLRITSEVVNIDGAKHPTRFSVMDYLNANYAR